MSLVPFSQRDSREIVLRHNDAIVVRDPQTQQLILRGVSTPSSGSECPTCHRPFRSPSPERSSSPHRPHRSTPFISPEYFRMLQAAYDRGKNNADPPSSPIRRLVQPAFPLASTASSTDGSISDAEFVASTPAPQTGHSIKKKAFTSNYFKDFFIEEKELGRGGKGVVLLVTHQLDGVPLGQFACKRVPVGDDHVWLEKVLVEVQLLQRLSHPNLVSYRHVWLEDVKLNRFGPSVPCAYILQQYCNSGDLHQYILGPALPPKSPKEEMKEKLRRRSRGHSDLPDLIHGHRKLSFEEIYSFFKDITSGLLHLHSANYIHRDLKPSNCLLNRDGNDFRCLISDFGEVQAENVVRNSTGSTGTISYCAPEVLRKDEDGRYGNFTTKSDIFSLGLILYFMCFGRLPYANANSIEEEAEDYDLLRAEISSWTGFRGERRERPELPNQLYDFLKRLLATNPHDRPSADDILTAIQTEKGLENPTRRNSSAGGLSGRIIKTFDSPLPSGTPVNGPFHRPYNLFLNLRLPEPTKRVRSSAYMEDMSHDSPSPTPSPSTQLIHEANLHVHPHAHARSLSRSHSRQTDPLIPKTPAMLMAPESTRLGRIKHSFEIYIHYTVTWMVRNKQALGVGVRVAIFLAKFLTLTRPCAPFVTRDVVLWPLMMLAATEAAMGKSINWFGSLVLALLHVVSLLGVWAFGGGICARDGALHGWRWAEV